MHNRTKSHRGVQKDIFRQVQNTNTLRDARNNTTHMVFEGELSVKLHTKDVDVWTSTNENHREDQVTIGRVHSPGSTSN